MGKFAHFIGIGGVGMSGVAKMLQDKGIIVTGSDEEVYSPVLDFLKKEKISWKTPYAAENIPADADLIIIGKNAKLVSETNAEVAAAFASGKPIKSFPEVLADLSQGKETIAVAGSYGKSTCAALLAHCLEHAGLNPSYFIGAVPLPPLTSAKLGTGNLFVLEGDEYPSSNTDSRAKFLHYHPSHLLITPLAHDHGNVFPTPRDYLKPFEELVALVSGTIVACVEGPLSTQLIPKIKNPITYGFSEGEFQTKNIEWRERTSFDITRKGSTVVRVETSQLGEHNIQNIVGVGALVFSRNLVSPEQFASAVKSFCGVRRRLNLLSEKTTIPIFEGFGSSYEKVKSAIAAMKKHFPSRRLVVVFEPYTINWRRRETLPQYEDVFAGADKVFVLEPPLHGKGMEVTVEEIAKHARATPCHGADECLAQLNLQQNDCVLMFSSGPLGGLPESIPRLAEQKYPKP